MKHWLMIPVLSLLAIGPFAWAMSQDQSVTTGAATIEDHGGAARVVGNPTPVNQPEQSIETTVQDPARPDEPWVVVTYRKPGESLAGFVKRHKDTVDAVRDVLQ